MFSYIKKLVQIYTAPGKEKNSEKREKEPRKIEKNLRLNINYIKRQFDNSADLTIRPFKISGFDAVSVTIEGMTNKENLSESVMKPILLHHFKKESIKNIYDVLQTNVLSSCEQVETDNFENMFDLIMSGFAVLLFDGINKALAIGVQGFKFRGISEPSTEIMQRGAREGFVEPIKVNMTLIRRRIKNPKMKFEMLTIGSESNTDVCLCYMRDIVSDDMLKEVKKRLSDINLKTVMASGYILPYLEDKKDYSIFNGCFTSERPDTVCAKIMEGRICILVDGSPEAILIPYLFVEYFQNMDDYVSRPYYATFIRVIKYIAFFVSILLPGFYVAAGTFNPELFPEELLNKIAVSIATTPFSLLAESLLIDFVYEIMREAGLRLPKPLGHAVSIVGALVVGDASISSGFIGTTTLLILATSAICSYVTPNLYEPIAILRVAFILAGGLLGIWGIMLLLSVLIVNLCAKSTLGIPFMLPIAPFNLYSMRDVVVRAPWWILSQKTNTVSDMSQRSYSDD